MTTQSSTAALDVPIKPFAAGRAVAEACTRRPCRPDRGATPGQIGRRAKAGETSLEGRPPAKATSKGRAQPCSTPYLPKSRAGNGLSKVGRRPSENRSGGAAGA